MRQNQKLRLVVGIVCTAVILILVSYVAYGYPTTDQPEVKGLKQGHEKLCKDAWPDDPLKEDECITKQTEAEYIIYFGVMQHIQNMPETNQDEAFLKLFMKAVVVKCLRKNSVGDVTDSVSSLQCINGTLDDITDALFRESIKRGGAI